MPIVHWPYGADTHFEARIHPGNPTMRTPRCLRYPDFALTRHPQAAVNPNVGWLRVPKRFFPVLAAEKHEKSGLPVIMFQRDRKSPEVQGLVAKRRQESLRKQAGLQGANLQAIVTQQVMNVLQGLGLPPEALKALMAAQAAPSSSTPAPGVEEIPPAEASSETEAAPAPEAAPTKALSPEPVAEAASADGLVLDLSEGQPEAAPTEPVTEAAPSKPRGRKLSKA